MSQQTKIIIFIIIIFIASSAYLFWVDAKNNSPDYGKDWWAVYFENPKDNSLNFTIENHSNKNDFHWEVSDGKNKLDAGNIKIEKGATWTSDVQVSVSDKKMTIRVSNSKDTKEIYKNL